MRTRIFACVLAALVLLSACNVVEENVETNPSAAEIGETIETPPSIDPADVNWLGTYESYDYTLGITDYDGEGFAFNFLNSDGEETENAYADLDPDNPRCAQYENIIFELYDVSIIEITWDYGDDDYLYVHESYAGTYCRIVDDVSDDSNDDEEPASSYFGVKYVLTGKERTEAFYNEIYTAFHSHSFNKYLDLENAEWLAFGEDERHQAYEDFVGMLTQIGFDPDTDEAAWLEAMDSEAQRNSYAIWYTALIGFSFSEADMLIEIYNYVRGIEEGEYQKLHPEIFAAADDVTVQYWHGQFLICVGDNHVIDQTTKESTTKESFFYTLGSLNPLPDGSIFIEYSMSGEKGIFEKARFGETDFLPIFKALGAIDEDGLMVSQQIQISAKSRFDASRLFVMAEDNDGFITFTIAEYSKEGGKYIWGGELFETNERCCFDKKGNFCYIDNSGSLVKIP